MLPLVLATLTAPRAAPPAGGVGAIVTMTRRPDGRYDVVCRSGRRELATLEEIRTERVCRGPGAPAGSGARLGVVYGRTDDCDADAAIATVRVDTDCNTLSATSDAWSVAENGVCRDIDDASVRGACLVLQGGVGTVLYGRTDDCDASAVLFRVDPYTACGELSATEETWSRSVEGRCVDTEDMGVRAACFDAQAQHGAIGGGTILYGRSDDCDPRAALLRVDDATVCEALPRDEVVWSRSMGGRCTDLEDAPLRTACVHAQSGMSP